MAHRTKGNKNSLKPSGSKLYFGIYLNICECVCPSVCKVMLLYKVALNAKNKSKLCEAQPRERGGFAATNA